MRTRLFNYRFFRSLQFWIGIGLAAIAFLGISMYARLFTPTPIQIVVARAEIPAYTRLDKSLLAVDSQVLSPKLAARYVTAGELPGLLGDNAVVVETIHVGETLSKQRLAVGPDALKVSRLALALKDPNKVIRNIPAKQDQFPGMVVPGDLVDVYVTFGSPPSGEITYTRALSNVVSTPETIRTSVTATPAPVEESFSIKLPVSKRLLSGLLVVRVNHEMVQNPNYGIGAGAQSEPAYVEGQVRSFDVLVDADEAEKIDFALANGKITLGLRSALARQAIEQGTPVAPSSGWSWTDFAAEFWTDRLANVTPTLAPAAAVTPTPMAAPPTVAPPAATSTPSAASPSTR